MKLIVQAVNIHQGGGKTLLLSIIKAIPESVEVILLADTRMEIPYLPKNLIVYQFKPTIFSRLKAEWLLFKLAKFVDVVVCFGNLPPLLALPANVFVYLQNRYLVDQVGLSDVAIKLRIRLTIERLWLKIKSKNIDRYIVQTALMRQLLINSDCYKGQEILIGPFLEKPNFDNHQHKEYDFAYVASGDKHKNHKTLIRAWCLLAQQGFYPSLCITLDEKYDKQLVDWVCGKICNFNLKILNFSNIDNVSAISLLGKSRALIYPSLLESFGIPLVEAKSLGLAVLASELDYVRDILDPDQTFDPMSEISIARAVRRHLALDESRDEILSSRGFIEMVINHSKLD